MSRQIQNPDASVALAQAYDIKGALALRLDELVVPVHIVGVLNPEDPPPDAIPLGSRGAMGFGSRAASAAQRSFVGIQARPRGAFPFLVEWVELYHLAAPSAADTYFGSIGEDPDWTLGPGVVGNPFGWTEPPDGPNPFGDGAVFNIITGVGVAGDSPTGPVIFESGKYGALTGHGNTRHYLNWKCGRTPTGAALSDIPGNDRVWFGNGTLNEALRLNAKVWVLRE